VPGVLLGHHLFCTHHAPPSGSCCFNEQSHNSSIILNRASPQMTACNPGISTSLIKKVRTYCTNLLKAKTQDTSDLVFSVMMIIMVTCIGSMVMLCFFFEMEQRSPSPHRQPQQSSVLPTF
jgi:hypothetical protein